MQALHVAGAQIIYLTGRDQVRMLQGTEKSLRQWQFPMNPPRVELMLKPRPEDRDSLFKLEVMRDIAARHKRVWFFENEPVNINLVLQELPSVEVVFLDTTHSRREEPPPHLHRIKDFLY